MKSEKRKVQRFAEAGKVSAADICAIPGVLDDISLTGCKVHFSVPVSLDFENDYILEVLFAKKIPSFKLQLLCHPVWLKENENVTEIGFSILTSPSTPELNSYIKTLSDQAAAGSEIEAMFKDGTTSFIRDDS